MNIIKNKRTTLIIGAGPVVVTAGLALKGLGIEAVILEDRI